MVNVGKYTIHGWYGYYSRYLSGKKKCSFGIPSKPPTLINCWLIVDTADGSEIRHPPVEVGSLSTIVFARF